jgi:hypothetical protein
MGLIWLACETTEEPSSKVAEAECTGQQLVLGFRQMTGIASELVVEELIGGKSLLKY